MDSIVTIEGLAYNFEPERRLLTLYVDGTATVFRLSAETEKIMIGCETGQPNYRQILQIMKDAKTFAQLIGFDAISLHYPDSVIIGWIDPIISSIVKGEIPDFFQLGFCPFNYLGDDIGYEQVLYLIRDILMGHREHIPSLIRELNTSSGAVMFARAFTFMYWMSDKLLEYKSEQSPDPMYSILTGRGSRFPSHRMKTTMSAFIDPDKPVMSISQEELNQITSGAPLTRGDSEHWPVSRYGSGMSRGMFHHRQDRPDHIHGTFYYLEPGSNAVLEVNSSRILVAFNKIAAISKLIDWGHEIASITKSFHDKINHDLYTPHGTLKNIDYLAWSVMQDQSPCGDPSTFEGLDRNYLDVDGCYRDTFYAHEDIYDQDLCILAQHAGYDVVILTNMAGKERVVTELLDTRPQSESFASLTRIFD